MSDRETEKDRERKKERRRDRERADRERDRERADREREIDSEIEKTNAYSTHFLHRARGDIESVQSCSSRFTGIALIQGVALNV